MCGNDGKQKYPEMLVFLLLARESVKEERGMRRGKKWNCVTIDRRMGGRLHCLYVYSLCPITFALAPSRYPAYFAWPRLAGASQGRSGTARMGEGGWEYRTCTSRISNN